MHINQSYPIKYLRRYNFDIIFEQFLNYLPSLGLTSQQILCAKFDRILPILPEKMLFQFYQHTLTISQSSLISYFNNF